jgi:hypothetical protein
MSDDRFDADLRSVLIESAPAEVPEDLRRRVAAVPATHPSSFRPGLRSWRPPPLQLAAAAAVALVAFVLWSSRFGSQLAVGGDPSATATGQPSATATLTSGGSLSPLPCGAGDLIGTIVDWQGAAGSRIAEVEVSNAGGATCLVRGTPGVRLVDANERVLIDSAAGGSDGQPHVKDGDAAIELAPGAVIGTEVSASNYCGPDPSLPVHLTFTLPAGSGSFDATHADGVPSDMAVPPCLGPTSAAISMNGWRR